MGKEKDLLEEIEKFLNYLQNEDFNPKKRQRLPLKYSAKNKRSDRVVKLCLKSGYILEEKEPYETYRISTEGLKFLKDFKNEKNQEEIRKTQNYLTFGLFAITFLQGMTLIFYNYLDLKVRNFQTEANVFIILSCFIFIGIFVALIKFQK